VRNQPKRRQQNDSPKPPQQDDAPRKPARAAKVRQEKPAVIDAGSDDEADNGWNGPMPSFLGAKLNR
jgi:hypothetical protein